MTELLPCPFEREETVPELITERRGNLWYAWVKCPKCDASMVGISDPWGGDPRQSAIDMAARQWNTRYERTCHAIHTHISVSGECCEAYVCSECENPIDYGHQEYCSGCGAKVVDE